MRFPEMNPRYSVAKGSEDPMYLLVLTSGNEWTRNVSEARTFQDKDEARRHAKELGAWVIQCAVCDHTPADEDAGRNPENPP